MSLIVAIQGAQPILMDTNASVCTPNPLVSTMQMMVVIIPSPKVPVRTDFMPPRTVPAPQDAKAIQVTANATPPSPEPARSPVVMVSAPEMPVRANASPMALVVAVQGSQSVEVNSDATITAPSPAVPSMEMMVVIVATPQVPVCADCMPPSPGPTLEDASAVEMAADSPIATPEPTWALVVVVPTPQMPICSHSSPVTLVVSVQGAQPVEMNTNAAETSPCPSSSAMQVVVVMVFAPEVPITSHIVPP